MEQRPFTGTASEQLNHAGFRPIEFDEVAKQAGVNSSILTARRWIESTCALSLVSKIGRHGGDAFAHQAIGFEFAPRMSVEFRLYLIKEIQRLKEDENRRCRSCGKSTARGRS